MRRALLFSLLVFSFALANTSFTPLTSGRGVGILQGSSAWSQQTSGTANELRSVHFTSETEGWAAGANATLLRTTNGGANWTAVNTGVDPARGFHTVRFLDRSVGWVGGDSALGRTTNGGANWATTVLPTSVSGISNATHNSFAPLSATEIWAGGTGTFIGVSAFLAQYLVSADGTLSRPFTESRSPTVIQDIFLSREAGELDGWTVGDRILRLTRSGLTFQSSGGGQPSNGIQMLYLNNNWSGWVVGNNGTILKTINGGEAWAAQPSGTTANLRDVHFVNASRGWAVGNGGVILTTTDGGATWVAEPSGVTANLRSVFFVNETTGFAVGDNGTILKRGGPSSPAAVTTVSAASFTGAELAAESIVAAFGQGLATATEAATSVPLPTTLAGASVRVRDSAGTERAAPLFFVSPLQINYQIPPSTAPGAASISVVGGATVVAAGTAPIALVAPGLFAANANGQGVPAAVVFRRKADGSESFEPVAQFNQSQNRFVATPIDLGPVTDQVSLILFGTGIRFRSAWSAVACGIGGASAPVSFAGAQGGFVGLDQVNVSLQRSLAGRGEVDVVLMVDGKTANTVRIAIK